MAREDAREGAHWKERATRCAIPGCSRTRVKGWTTCSLLGHNNAGRSLQGLRPGMEAYSQDVLDHLSISVRKTDV